MAKIDVEFGKLCREIKMKGREYENKNRGVKRLQIPSYTFKHKFSDGFPALTNKKLLFKWVVGELIWFLRGDTDIRYLKENGIPIWDKDAYNWYIKGLPKGHVTLTLDMFSRRGFGSVGQNYSAQWRNFNGDTDQILALVHEMRADIMSSRLKVNAWNPSELNETALPPCHSEFQVVGVPLTLSERVKYLLDNTEIKIGYNKTDEEVTKILDDNKIPEFGFELHWNQRSVDTFLGLPFNIASYGVLAKVLEKLTGYPALGIEGTLKCVHFYDNQYEAVEELLARDPKKHGESKLVINPDFDITPDMSIDDVFNDLKISDFTLEGYTSDDAIKVDMLAPKEL